jgi:hypothetical protein
VNNGFPKCILEKLLLYKNMSDWVKKLFIKNSEIFLKLLNERWSRSEEVVNGMVKCLAVSASLGAICLIYAVEMDEFPYTWLRGGLRLLEGTFQRLFLKMQKERLKSIKFPTW